MCSVLLILRYVRETRRKQRSCLRVCHQIHYGMPAKQKSDRKYSRYPVNAVNACRNDIGFLHSVLQTPLVGRAINLNDRTSGILASRDTNVCRTLITKELLRCGYSTSSPAPSFAIISEILPVAASMLRENFEKNGENPWLLPSDNVDKLFAVASENLP